MPNSICIFCGSSLGSREIYAAAAVSLAKHLVAANITIVYGGSKVGLMGVLADTALAAGGKIIGVIPRVLVAKEVAHRGLADLRIVESMHQRKALMSELSDAFIFIAMPGGYGTFEEFCEVLTWTQLGLQAKPCGLLNVNGYYDDLLRLFDHAVAEKFLKPEHRQLVFSGSDPEILIQNLLASHIRPASKWINPTQT